jgi:hypothetical protein
VLIRNDIDRIRRLIDDDENKPLIAITLTGQVARTELQSKLKYLLASTDSSSTNNNINNNISNNNNNHNIVLIIVMNDGATRFTNFQNNQQAMSFNGTLYQLVDELASSMQWPMIVLQTDNDEIATQTPLIATELLRSQHWVKDTWYLVSVLAQQYSKLSFATSIIEHVEQQLHFKFDYVVKLRDDDLLLPTFDLNYVIEQLTSTGADVAVVGCAFGLAPLDDHLRVLTRRALNATSYDLLTMVYCYCYCC